MCVKGFALPAEDEMIGVAGFCDDPRYQLFPRDVERVFLLHGGYFFRR
jgi:hypothetical protein